MINKMSQTVVEVDNLSLEFLSPAGNLMALKGVSLEISKGEIVGIVGESGSGKSVTAMNLLQLLPKTKINIPNGSVSVLNKNVTVKCQRDILST